MNRMRTEHHAIAGRRQRRPARRFLWGVIGTTLALAGDAAAGVWQPVGPAGVVLRALAVGPASPGRMYVATNSAGVYRSEDGGVTWFARSIGIGNPSIRALAVDPTSPLTLYAGGSGGAFFRSADGGDSWSLQNADLPPSDVS